MKIVKPQSLTGTEIVLKIALTFCLLIIAYTGQSQNQPGLHIEESFQVLFGADTTSEGVKLFWKPSKGALKYGFGSIDDWADSNIGKYSSSWGQNTKAVGFASTAWGVFNTARGYASTVWGGANEVKADNGTAWGIGNISWSPNETVLGYNATDYVPLPPIQVGNMTYPNPQNRLFVIGGSIDTVRHNVFTMLKNGQTGFGLDPFGLGHRIRISGIDSNGSDTSAVSIESFESLGQFGQFEKLLLDGDDIDAVHTDLLPTYRQGSFTIGNIDGVHLGIDGNEIMARDSHLMSTLFLQADGGEVRIGGISATGTNINFNGTEIQAQIGNNPSTMFLQTTGGEVRVGHVVGNKIGLLGKEINATDGGQGPTNLILQSNGADVNVGLDLFVGGSQQIDEDLHVIGETKISSLNGGGTADVQVTATGILVRAVSDKRLKKDIESIEGALNKVVQLKGVSFNWKEHENENKTLGVIAQEVIEIVPELVTENGSYYGVNYSEFPALLIEAIKEQQKMITQLQSDVDALQSENENYKKLEARLSALERVHLSPTNTLDE